MNPYNDNVEKIMQLLKKRKVCLWSRKSHKVCYDEFGEFLKANDLKYTHQSAETWLERVIRSNRNQQEFYAKSKYMKQLAELIDTGTVINDHLLLTKSNYDKLPKVLKDEVNKYLLSRKKDYSKRSLELARFYCSKFMLYLSERGIMNIGELQYNDICDFFQMNHQCNHNSKFVLFSHTRQMLSFYASEGDCLVGFSLLLKIDMFPYVVVFDIFEPEIKSEFELLSQTNCVYTPSRIFDSIDGFIEVYRGYGYKSTVIKSAIHTLHALYLFLDVFTLNYHPKISQLWFAAIKSIIGVSFSSWRRVLKLFEYHLLSIDFPYNHKCAYIDDRMNRYSEYFQNILKGYLNYLKRTYHSESTLRNYKYNIWSFYDYLVRIQVNDVNLLSPQLINDYLKEDKHKTFKGRKSRILVLRRFIIYLEDLNLIDNKNLHNSLSTEIAPTVKIVEVLSDENIASIYKCRDEICSAIEIRNIAMVLIGLRLGFRASDVVNLKFQDINWYEKTLTIIQEKTKVPITLPLANDVGNSIYKYIKSARPKSASEYIFIRHRAPYGKLTTKICIKALHAVIPEVSKYEKAGFGLLRRTFATSILKRNVGIEAVIDSLGHQDDTTVMKYLAFDDERMSRCPISLEECDIQIERGVLL
ncbi:MAG: tyrosine-type recombinase/integrase [Alkaliphilus sp.]